MERASRISGGCPPRRRGGPGMWIGPLFVGALVFWTLFAALLVSRLW